MINYFGETEEKMKNLSVVVLVLAMASSAGATIISADADGYIDGTDISTAFSAKSAFSP